MNTQHDWNGTILEPPPGLDPDCYLFLGDPEKKHISTFGRVYMPIGGSFIFLMGSLMANSVSRIPLRSAMHKHIAYAIGGIFFGEGCWRFKQNYTSEKDIQYFHYMVLHPEDFKAPERKTFGQTLRPWTPFR